jgi:hypothetical protein
MSALDDSEQLLEMSNSSIWPEESNCMDFVAASGALLSMMPTNDYIWV